MIRYGSSFRAADIETTLAHAQAIAPQLGISRVTEVTYLDRIGVPVFVAIRPDAQPGSVCVSAGKGMTAAEARIGAYMEAIELAWAEYRRTQFPLQSLPSGEVLDGRSRPEALLDFCPSWGQFLDRSAEMWCVPAQDIVTGESWLIPAETVFHPLPAELGGARYFGSGSNGLASGNSVLEATVHALAEVIERDVTSFHNARDASRLIAATSLPEPIASLLTHLNAQGFELVVRGLPNPFGLPCFMAVSFDRTQPEVTLRGDGCHPVRSIALLRAVTETIQCRLSLIHGGRDDLANVHRPFKALSPEERAEVYAKVLGGLLRDPQPLSYSDVPDHADQISSLESCLGLLVARLYALGFPRVLRFVYTPPDYPVQVVRIVVPGLECYSRDTNRIGPRLRRYLRV